MAPRATGSGRGRGTRPPAHLAPMLATPARELPAGEAAWAYELKWDGIRAVAHIDGSGLRLESRNLKPLTATYPELHGLAKQVGASPVILDGEIVALDDAGRPSFQRLQERMGVTAPSEAARRAAITPAQYYVFDLLHLGDHSLLDLPYTERRRLLEYLEVEGAHWRTPSRFDGEGAGAATLDTARRYGLEGVVAKRLDSTYRPGTRSKAWLKVKLLEEEELVIGGWAPGEGRRAGAIGSLLVGRYDDRGVLHYCGGVGTGLTEAMLARLAERLTPLRRDTSPFAEGHVRRDAVYVEPRLVATVEFRERTAAGILRQPSFKGLRDDLDPRTVTGEAERVDLGG